MSLADYKAQIDAANAQRQGMLYVYTVNVYRIGDLSARVGMADPDYEPVAIYTDLACQFISTPENDQPTDDGRTKAVNIFTLDQFHFKNSDGVEILDADVLKMTGGPAQGGQPYPEIGKCWAVQGNAQTKGTFANYFMVYAKQHENPFGNGLS